jgi:thiol-disulfide isomerase/thioredoxin
MSATPGLWILGLLLSFVLTAPLQADSHAKWPTTFTLLSLDGKRAPRSAADFKGQPVLLQFWASWCRSCSGISSEMERLVQSHQESKGSRLHFLSVSIDETMDEARKTVEQRKSTFLAQHAFHDKQQQLRTALKIDSVPTIVLIDREGSILLRKEGHLAAHEYLEIKNVLSRLSP